MPTKKAPAPAVVKKASAKKTVSAPVKKAAPKSAGKKSLVYADNKHSFWVVDGQILNSLVALRDAFASMDKTVYAHHTSHNHNHFADWAEKVLHDADCAKSLRVAKTPASAKTIVVRALKSYAL